MFTLDWGTGALKMIRFSRSKGEFWPQEFQVLTLTEKPLGKEKEDVKLMRQYLQEIFKEIKMTRGRLRITLPATGSNLLLLNLPSLNKAELREAVHWEVCRVLNLDPYSGVIRFSVIEEKKEGIRVLAAALEQRVLDFVQASLPRNPWIRVERATLTPLALSALLGGDKNNLVVIDCGSSKTDLLFLRGGKPIFLRQLGGFMRGSDLLGEPGGADHAAQLTEEISRALMYVPEIDIRSEAERILLVGGKGQDPQLARNLENSFQIKVSLREKCWPRENGARALLAPALGLARLGGQRNGTN